MTSLLFTPTLVTVLAVIWPVIGAVLVVLLGKRPNLREAASLATAASLFAGLWAFLLPAVASGARPRVEVVKVVAGLELAFAVEPLGMLFALVASGLWIVTTLYSIGYMRGHGEKNQTRFYACFALAITGAVGVAFAANVFTLFLFYEFITLATYPLVTHKGNAEARRAGRVYIGVLMGSSIAFLLLAAVWTQMIAGTTDFTPGGILAGKASPGVTLGLLALFIFGTGKAAVMPMHRWLPAAMVAPTPVSALLHAVAVVKAGVFTVLKVVIYIFGVDFLAQSGASEALAWAAAFTVMAASIVAITKDNLKARLAYSTISQLSYIVLGALLATSASVLGGAMHIAMHAFGKITLFFCAGALMVLGGKTEVSQLAGIGRRMPFTMLAFLVGSLSVIGLPPLGGSWSKWYLALGAAEAGQWVMVGVFMLSSLLSIGYLMPVVARAFVLRPEDVAKLGSEADVEPGGEPHPGDSVPHREPSRAETFLCVLPPVLTAVGCVVLFFAADGVYDLLRGIFTP